MKIEVLLSCMYQSDIIGLVERSNIQTDVVVVNQTDENSQQVYEFINKKGEICKLNIINTSERGLSKSRNMALRNANGDICVLCDDDEIFEDDYADTIIKAYKNNPEYSVLSFEIKNRGNSTSPRGYFKEMEINKFSALKLCSVQLTFLKKSIIDNKISFDERLGAGVIKAGGEEHKFLYDCLRNNLKIKNIPVYISALIINSSSTWREGYTKEYFYDKGYATSLYMGTFLSSLYACYTIILKYNSYKDKVSIANAIKCLYGGIFSKK